MLPGYRRKLLSSNLACFYARTEAYIFGANFFMRNLLDVQGVFLCLGYVVQFPASKFGVFPPESILFQTSRDISGKSIVNALTTLYSFVWVAFLLGFITSVLFSIFTGSIGDPQICSICYFKFRLLLTPQPFSGVTFFPYRVSLGGYTASLKSALTKSGLFCCYTGGTLTLPRF